jgi:hypothetical protein
MQAMLVPKVVQNRLKGPSAMFRQSRVADTTRRPSGPGYPQESSREPLKKTREGMISVQRAGPL